MVRDAKSGALAPAQFHERLLDYVPEAAKYAEFTVVPVFDLDSTNMHAPHWIALANEIALRYDQFDGFVVTHGTDTMAYTASMLSFLLQKLGKPVVLTGSQTPLGYDGTPHARMNLLNAIRFATMDLAEVCVCFGTQLLRGNRTLKFSLIDSEAFRSFNIKPIGTCDPEPVLKDHRFKRNSGSPIFYSDVEERVFLLKFFPGMVGATLEVIIDAGYKGLVIEGVGAGNLPTNPKFPKHVQRIVSRGIPVIVTTQCSVGKAEMSLYEVGKVNEDAGAISAFDMTPVAAFTKLAWILKQTTNLAEVKKLFVTNLAGEISPI